MLNFWRKKKHLNTKGNDNYEKKLSRVKSTWDRWQVEYNPDLKLDWWHSPVIMAHCQELVTGDLALDIYGFIKKEILSETIDRGLSICSGSGDFERGLLDHKICRHIDAYEISEERVKEGRRLSKEGNYSINFITEDINFAIFKKNYYDIFFSWSALHHVKNLEVVCQNARAALKKGGLVIAQEFIGPNQFQWTDKQVLIINKILNILPERYRLNLRTKQLITAFKRPTIEEMNRTDPSEAIRSEDIIEVLKQFFNVTMIRYFGGSLFLPLFNGIMGNFDHDDKDAVALIKMILLLEQTLIDEGVLSHNYAVIIAQNTKGL